MNNLQPYEKHLANELRNVPVPDKEQGWEEMRKLLERDRPVGGGPWSGNRKWYWMGLTVLLIIGGLWGSQRISQTSSVRKDILAETQSKTSSTPKSLTAETQRDQPSISKTSSISNPTNEKDSNKELDNKESNKNELDNKESNNKEPGNQESGNQELNSISKTKSNNVSRNNVEVALTKKNQSFEFKKDNSAPGVYPERNRDAVNNTTFKSEVVTTVERSYSLANISSINYENRDDIEVPIPSNTVSDPIIAGKTDKAFLKEARKKGMEEDNRKMSKRSMKGNFGEKEQELTFAAGLALPKTFAVGGQQALGYGINGKTNTITDYLPVPYFQYHLNDKMFVQTELHFQSPQFTDRLLIYQKQNEVSATNRTEKNIFVEKLYYFNIPFNFYYSPIKNFYIGSGIQYSSLLSGLASFEEKKYAGGTLENTSSRVLRFKDDSVAKKLSPSELRYQFDANYYVKRFTLGLRYNQAMKNFVNVQPGLVLPYTQGRNKSFLLYLRYNIWEERRKNKY